MKKRPLWNGVRMRNLQAAIDPDAPLHSITIPDRWEDSAATAIMQLCPEYQLDSPTIKTDRIIANWLLPLCDYATSSQIKSWNMTDWENILLLQQACPNASTWKNDISQKPSFTINLAAFASTETGFDAESYQKTLQILIDSIRLLYKQQFNFIDSELPFPDLDDSGKPSPADSASSECHDTAGTLYLTNLDACLARLGLDYDSDKGRDVACCLSCFATLMATAGCGADYLPLSPDWNTFPELATHAKNIWSQASEASIPLLPRIATGFSVPGPEDLLLGSESCGLAPIFSPVTEEGHLAFSTIARMAKQGLTPESALAATLMGKLVLQPPSHQAHRTMYQALATFVTSMPSRPCSTESPLHSGSVLPRGIRDPLPSRHKGINQRASIAGRGLFLRTGEYENGQPGEISITPVKENAMIKGLLENFGQAVSIGLQYGVPLKEFVSAFAYSHFGIAGTVEGDPGAVYATSFLDYSFRALSDVYLNQPLPDAPNNLDSENGKVPMLPLDLPVETDNEPVHPTPPSHSRRKKFKLVG